MSKKSIQIPFYNFGGKGNVIHFAHANAYPPGSYEQMMQPLLANYKVIGLEQRPLWKDSQASLLKNWNLLADDLITFFDQQGLRNVIGMGHSMGGVVSILAAQRRPDLFSKLVLIDPVIFPTKLGFFSQLIPFALRKRMIPIAKLAAKRRDLWPDQKTVFNSFRTKKVFKQFSDTVLWDFVRAGTKKIKSGEVTMEEGMRNADSVNDLRLRVKLGESNGGGSVDDDGGGLQLTDEDDDDYKMVS